MVYVHRSPAESSESTSDSGRSRVGIVADDLTGAGDSAVQFARDGWRARLAFSTTSGALVSAHSVLAVVTDARRLGPVEAEASTAAGVRDLLRAGADQLFVKIDSTMRGSVAAQIVGAVDGWNLSHAGSFAIVCPAYPAMGRTVRGGRILVGDVPVDETGFADDPVTPVATSLLGELVPGSIHLGTRLGEDDIFTQLMRAASVAGDAGTLAGAAVLTVDAVTNEDLRAIADAAAHIGPRAVLVGSAGLASAMSRSLAASAGVRAGVSVLHARPPLAETRARRVLVVVSSLHDVSRAQRRRLVAVVPSHRVRVFAPPAHRLVEPRACRAWVSDMFAAEPELPPVVVIAPPDERSEPSPGAPAGAHSAAIAAGLATLAAAVFAYQPFDALVVLGGEGARAVFDELGAHAFVVTDTIREGVPIGLIEGGVADGVIAVTKAGGFGAQNTVAEIVAELLGETAAPESEPPTKPVTEPPTEKGEPR